MYFSFALVSLNITYVVLNTMFWYYYTTMLHFMYIATFFIFGIEISNQPGNPAAVEKEPGTKPDFQRCTQQMLHVFIKPATDIHMGPITILSHRELFS